MELVTCLLPEGVPLQVEAWSLDHDAAQMIVRATSTQPLTPCPVGGFPTHRIHSQYTRMVADLPWASLRVVAQLGVRTFFCANGRCTRRIFTERLLKVVAPGRGGPSSWRTASHQSLSHLAAPQGRGGARRWAWP